MARNRGKVTNHLWPAYDKVWREVDVANGAWSLICRENPHRRCLTFQNRDASHPMEVRSGDGKDIGFMLDKFVTASGLGASFMCMSEMLGNLDEQAWYARGQSEGATILVIEGSTNGQTPPAPPCDQSSSSSSSSSTASSSSSSTASSSSSSSPSSSSTALVNSSSSSSSSPSASSTSLSSTSSRSSSSSTTGAQNSSSSSDIYPSSSSSSSDV